MRKEFDLEAAIVAAENEGMTGRVQPIPKPRLLFDDFDKMAMVRAEGEGMVDRRSQLKQHKQNGSTLTVGIPAELPHH